MKISDFYPKNHSTCKSCVRQRVAAWRKANPEKVKQYDKKNSENQKRNPNYVSQIMQRYAKKNPEKVSHFARRYRLKKKYRLSIAEYDGMLSSQENVCKICRRVSSRTKKNGDSYRLVVDHCHVTQKVRGLLCNSCNFAIGLLGDEPTFFLRAFEYLQDSGSWR